MRSVQPARSSADREAHARCCPCCPTERTARRKVTLRAASSSRSHTLGRINPCGPAPQGRRRAAMVDRARLKAFEHSNNHDALAAHR